MLEALPVAFQVHAEVSLPGAIIFSSCLQLPAFIQECLLLVTIHLLPFDLIVCTINKMVLRTRGYGIAVFKPSLIFCGW